MDKNEKMKNALAVRCGLQKERYKENVRKAVCENYTKDDEIAELRKMVAKLCEIIKEADSAEFLKYHNYVESIKAKEKSDLMLI